MRHVYIVGLGVLLIIVYMLGDPTSAAAAMLPQEQKGPAPEKLSCDGKHLQVTLGLLPEYKMPSADDGTGALCISVTTGNAYELLSWLENGGLRAAVLPSFAVQVLRADNPARFQREYLEFASSPLSVLPLKKRTIILTHGAQEPVRVSDLPQFFASLTGSSHSATILLPHHLSPAVPLLFTRAATWTKEQNLSSAAREAFFKALIEAIRFRVLARATPSTDATPTLELAEAVDGAESAGEPLHMSDSDRLVVRRQLLASHPELRAIHAAVNAPTKASASATGLFAPTREEEKNLSTSLVAFRDANYGRFEQGWFSQRYFRFTLDELWTLLQAHNSSNKGSPQGIALVLTGGGVKAAYQTRLIDHLYSSGRLFNDVPAKPSTVATKVNYVIGTSGGALLGIFVSALNNRLVSKLVSDGTLEPLTTTLWGAPGTYLRSQDVFPRLDMLRYASVIACFLMLLLASALALRFWNARYPHITKLTQNQVRFVVRRARGLTESWAWILVLAVAPVLIVKVSSVHGLEHMPPVTGVIYMIMILIALYADLRLTPHTPFTWRKVRVPTISTVLAIIGLSAVAVSLYGAQFLLSVPGFGAGQLGSVFVCGLGFILLAAALYFLYARQSQYFTLEPRWPIISAALVVAGLAGLSYLGLALGVWLQGASFLEVTGSFWGWLLLSAFGLSCMLLYLGQVSSSSGKKLTRFQSTVAFLLSEHPSRALWTSHRRYTRFMTLAAISWLWWNLLAAPGLYGNHNAQRYFRLTFEKFAKIAASSQEEHPLTGSEQITQTACGDTAEQSQDRLPLTVPFVVTAISLEKAQERYFLFVNYNAEATDSSLSDQAWFNIVSDPRWIVARNAAGCVLRSVAFASGSPFPVFSSHAVELPEVKALERLIDGGFAHNKPLEAAKALGARSVLVLNSSPLDTTLSASHCTLPILGVKLGELACNLPKLIPYLWERSQVEDTLSSESMLVASIYPTPADGGWPLLVDFRGEVIERMRQAADADKTRRIGVIERWSVPPPFEDPQLFSYNADTVRLALGKQ